MYAVGESWVSWMQDFRYGTLAFVPHGGIRTDVDILRKKYDPVSAQTSMAHITVTQPFAKQPSPEDVLLIKTLVSTHESFESVIGPATTSPNKRLLWLDVKPKELILSLREKLHETGLFRTDLPLTKGFIPHMTISEVGREPDAVQSINEIINKQFESKATKFSSLTWIVPDENFVFREFQIFTLK